MADTLHTIHLIASDIDFQSRLNAAAAQENVPGEPTSWVWNKRYNLSAAPSWAEKVDYWMANNPDGGNGWALDPAVISDGDITARVQQVKAQA